MSPQLSLRWESVASGRPRFWSIFEHPHRSPSASVAPEISAPRHFDSISAFAGKRQQKNMEKPKQSTHRDLSSQGTLSMKTALGEDTTRQSNVQVLWDDMMIDVGIFGSYLIDSERKFMGFGSSNPHIALGFTQFLTVWYIYIYMFDTDSNMLRDAPWSNWRGPPWSRCQQKLRRGFSDSPFEQVCNGLHMHESHADTTSSHMFREHAHKLDLRSWHQWPLDGPHV